MASNFRDKKGIKRYQNIPMDVTQLSYDELEKEIYNVSAMINKRLKKIHNETNKAKQANYEMSTFYHRYEILLNKREQKNTRNTINKLFTKDGMFKRTFNAQMKREGVTTPAKRKHYLENVLSSLLALGVKESPTIVLDRTLKRMKASDIRSAAKQLSEGIENDTQEARDLIEMFRDGTVSSGDLFKSLIRMTTNGDGETIDFSGIKQRYSADTLTLSDYNTLLKAIENI